MAKAQKAEVIRDKYDIIWGQWIPRQQIGIPGTDNKMVLKWEFQPEGKPRKTGVPMDADQVKTFNDARKLRAVKAFTEQMVPTGSTEPIFDTLPNPYEVQEL